MAKFQVTWINEHTGEVFDTLEECTEAEQKYEEVMKEKEKEKEKKEEKEEKEEKEDDVMPTEDAQKVSKVMVEFQEVWDAFQFAESIHNKNEHIASDVLEDLEKEVTDDAYKKADKFREKWGIDVFLTLITLYIDL